MTASDLTALESHLTADPGDDDVRLIYADALEDGGREDEANAHRAIAGMKLGLYARLGGTERSGIRWAFADHYDVPEDGADGVVVNEDFDAELLVATYVVADDQISEGPYVISSTRGDLTLEQLRRMVSDE